MAFSGTYQLESQENFETFMRAVGLPEELIEKGKHAKSVTEVVQNGNHFIFTVTTGPRVQRSEFTIGEEAEFDSIKGGKVKAVVNQEGNKLITKLEDITTVTEFDGDKLINVMTLKDINYKRISKKV
ncbi:fatty acid-binding, liver [Pelobates cultripes]|uniref:Liver-type fatty acid-binding protein n=1 Tax=Pelobates cultripes TaxID=61616 RepID=A0AAD1WD07_PELCU|nr:fatty acid-binding, liver [Pelobates cultripes]